VAGCGSRDRLGRKMASVAVIAFIIFLVLSRRGDTAAWLFDLVWASFFKFALLFLVVTPIAVISSALDGGFIGATLFALAVILLFAPSLVLQSIIVPLGWPRAAYRIARWCRTLEVVQERDAGAAFYGALALARHPEPAKDIVDWLALKMERAPMLRGAGVVATGLLAALRGERIRARSLLRIAHAAERPFISHRARVVARDWLVADAARGGDWREVAHLGRGWPSLRWSYAVGRMAERLARDPRASGDTWLRACWLMAPRRRTTLPLLRCALAVPRGETGAVATPPMVTDLPQALTGLADALAHRFVHDGAALARVVAAVDSALGCEATTERIKARSAALDAELDPAAIVAGMRARLTELLAPAIEESPRLATGDVRPPSLDQAAEEVRARWFRDIEAQCRDYAERNQRQSALAAVAEWQAWATTRDNAEQLLALAPASEYAVFHAMYVPVCNFAVFQHNICKRLVLAHEIYAWLHRHAKGDDAAAALLLRNMKNSRV
jgi:hypothetical protein